MDLKDFYKEIATLIIENTSVVWCDLWRNQTEAWEEEFPFPFPAVFVEIRSDNIEDIGNKAQDINAQIVFHVAYETLADSHHGSNNQEHALAYFDVIKELHQLLHGSHGTNFTDMYRTAIVPEEAGTNVIQYALVYNTVIRDYSASPNYTEQDVSGINIAQGKRPITNDNTFVI